MGGGFTGLSAALALAKAWKDFDWPAIPGNFGKPWFLPAVGAYYRLMDVLR